MTIPIDDERLMLLAQATADALARQYNSRYGSRIPVPVPLQYELELTKPKVAGMAWTRYEDRQGRSMISEQFIELNMTMFRDNVREFLNRVIPHEVAHLHQRYVDEKNMSKSADHGYVWQISMRAMSQVPTATHKMDCTKSIAAYKEHKAKIRKALKAAKKAETKEVENA